MWWSLGLFPVAQENRTISEQPEAPWEKRWFSGISRWLLEIVGVFRDALRPQLFHCEAWPGEVVPRWSLDGRCGYPNLLLWSCVPLWSSRCLSLTNIFSLQYFKANASLQNKVIKTCISVYISYFSGCYNKINLRVEIFILAHSLRVRSIMAGKAWQQECEAAGIHFICRQEADSDGFCVLNLSSLLFSPGLQAMEWCCPCSGRSSRSVKPFWSRVSLVILNLIKSTVKMNHPRLEHPKG